MEMEGKCYNEKWGSGKNNAKGKLYQVLGELVVSW